jgi:hypothetical protein
MANIDDPKGFTPVAMFNGAKIPVWRFPVDALNATAIFIGDVIDAEADGNVIPAAADADDSVIGVAVAVYDSNGVPCGAPNSSVSTKYLTALTAGYVDVALALPEAVFRVQVDGTIAETARFANANHVATAGSTTMAQSRHELSATTGTATAQFKIWDRVREPGNTWGANMDVLVTFNESRFVSTTGL